MARKRGVFDIDFELDADETAQPPAGNTPAASGLETKAFNVQGHPLQNAGPVPTPAPRRGPMASAISETVQAHSERSSAEAAIRAENDALAHEHVRLKKLGLITDLLRTDDIHIDKLTRDRRAGVDPELEELKESIRSVGLSNPIRVEQTDTGYELIQGFRRLCAFRELAMETGDPGYQNIPAALVPRGEPIVDLYRKMVDENLVRKDISFGEMAQLALSYAQDTGGDPSDAVGELYASARKQKRSYIRQFVRVLEMTKGSITHVEAIPRALGIDLCKALEADPDRAGGLVTSLTQSPDKTPEAEQRILREFLTDATRAKSKPAVKPVARTTLRVPNADGDVSVLAADGRIELRLNRDFSAVSRERLQRGVEQLLRALDEGD